MDFNDDVRFTAVCHKNIEILCNTKRNNIKNLVSINDTKKTLQRDLTTWEDRSKITDKVGRGLYVIASYEKIKLITIPLNNKHVLFISIDNTPLKTSNKKR